ncbi:hypothetical protein ACFSTA_18650 [Ornithinibacillus salinisoli]|uniref:DUF2513 domain-containing protein n=1 Tax=Ornithinibacillus salinisoli TaxID=1848459 RepID=A0ABW4W5V9_9BACI
MIKLTIDQIKLAEQLLIMVMKKEPIVEYKELGDRISPPMFHRQVPGNIEVISKLCYQLGLPFLSTKVVTKGINVPGEGFYKLYTQYFPEAKKLTPNEVFSEELKKIRECTRCFLFKRTKRTRRYLLFQKSWDECTKWFSSTLSI